MYGVEQKKSATPLSAGAMADPDSESETKHTVNAATVLGLQSQAVGQLCTKRVRTNDVREICEEIEELGIRVLSAHKFVFSLC